MGLPKVLPENILKRMDKSARATLGKAGLTATEANEKQSKELERQLHKDITNLLRQRGVKAIGHARMDKKSTYTEAWPDFTFMYQKFPCAVECKAPGKKPTPEQSAMLAQMELEGWCVIWTDNLESFRAWLNNLDSLRYHIIYDQTLAP